MATEKRPGQTGSSGPGSAQKPSANVDLDRRRRDLGAAIAARQAQAATDEKDGAKNGVSGMGQALKLSSEFVAGVVVGAGLGWMIDYAAGTSPWGLIVLLLLGFGAGVLNVMRSAGMVAQPGRKEPPPGGS